MLVAKAASANWGPSSQPEEGGIFGMAQAASAWALQAVDGLVGWATLAVLSSPLVPPTAPPSAVANSVRGSLALIALFTLKSALSLVLALGVIFLAVHVVTQVYGLRLPGPAPTQRSTSGVYGDQFTGRNADSATSRPPYQSRQYRPAGVPGEDGRLPPRQPWPGPGPAAPSQQWGQPQPQPKRGRGPIPRPRADQPRQPVQPRQGTPPGQGRGLPPEPAVWSEY